MSHRQTRFERSEEGSFSHWVCLIEEKCTGANYEKIQEFCSLNYGVTFPLFSKIDVKGGKQHPLYAILTSIPDDAGKAGNVGWNFEKFLIGRDGRPVRRFRSKVTPEDPKLVEAIESLL